MARGVCGSHYLWGSAGATPGSQDGSVYRQGTVSMARSPFSPWWPAVKTAWCDGSGEMHSCAGRCEYPGINGGLLTSEERTSLVRLYAPTISHPEITYSPRFPGFSGSIRPKPLTPRMVFGSNSDDNYKGKIVWGEDCTGIRHFDCIGFINYVFNKTSYTRNTDPKYSYWSGDIEGWYKSASTSEVAKGAPAVPGDILFKWTDEPVKKNPGQTVRKFHHIALLAEDGFVVQAKRSAEGVHDDEVYAPGNWQARRRLADLHFD